MWDKIKRIDIYPKLDDDLQVRTFSGAIVSILSGSLILYLFFSELNYYSTIEKVENLEVDLKRGEKLKINFDVTFPYIPCALLNLDSIDATGIRQIDLSHHVQKQPLDKYGKSFGETTVHTMQQKNDDAGKNVSKIYKIIHSGFCADTSGCNEIVNAAGCQSALSTLGIDSDKTVQTQSNQPDKCIFDTGSNNGYFNMRKERSPALSNYGKVCYCFGFSSDSKKQNPMEDPSYCGSCYGAAIKKGQCCNTCAEVKAVYKDRGWNMPNLEGIQQCLLSGETHAELSRQLENGDGCRMYGYMRVKKMAGAFHFTPGKSFTHAHQHMHDFAAFKAGEFNVSHKIFQLSFGERFPGIVNPLDHTEKVEILPPAVEHSQGPRIISIEDIFSYSFAELLSPPGKPGGKFMYYIKIVPTTYSYLQGMRQETNQFSVTQHFKALTHHDVGLPGVFFNYEISPIMVDVTETQRSLSHFLTQLCAILGGAFTVAGMIDKLIYKIALIIEKMYGSKRKTILD